MVFNFSCLFNSMMMSLLHLWGNAMFTNSPWSLSYMFSSSCITPRFSKKYSMSSIKHQRVGKLGARCNGRIDFPATSLCMRGESLLMTVQFKDGAESRCCSIFILCCPIAWHNSGKNGGSTCFEKIGTKSTAIRNQLKTGYQRGAGPGVKLRGRGWR